MRRVLRLTALAAAVLTLSACAGDGSPPPAEPTEPAEDLIALAQEEGEVVWYTRSRPETVDAVQSAFADKYGITVTSALSSGTDLARQIETDVRDTGSIRADVVATADLALASYLGEEELLAPLPAELLEDFPQEFMLDDTSAVYQISVAVIAYNSELLGEFRPGSWHDLLDPRLRGELMVNDPRGSAAWGQLWSTILHDQDLGADYISSIADQEYQPTATSLVGTEQLVAGQGTALIAGLPILFTQLIEDGMPIEYFFPEDPSPVFFNVIGVSAESANPSAGRLFLTWLLGEEGQALINSVDETASPLGDLNAEGMIALPEGYTTAPPPEQVREDLPRILELLGMN